MAAELTIISEEGGGGGITCDKSGIRLVDGRSLCVDLLELRGHLMNVAFVVLVVSNWT